MPEAFQKCFQDWVADAIPPDETNPDRMIAIDGKTNRAPHDVSQDFRPPHLVTAWASEGGTALG